MQRLIYMLVLLAIFGNVAIAQDNAESGTFVKEPSNEVWKGDKNVFNENASAQKWSAPKTPTYNNAPIDGGVIALLGAGILYGSRRFKKKRLEKTTVQK